MAGRKKQVVQPPDPVSDGPPHMMGYARVSTADQDPQLQIDALIRAGVAECDIFQEKVSGAAAMRPQFEAMMKDCRVGDIVVVWKLDRLGRNNIELHRIAAEIRRKGANLRLLDNSGLDTTTAAGNLMFGMLAVMAQFERDIGHERTMAGLQAARERGRIGGRKAEYTHQVILEAAKLGTKPGARKVGMSKSGFIKALARAQAWQQEAKNHDET